LRDGDKLGPCAIAIYADALRVRAKMAAAGETIATMPAGNVTFTNNQVAFGKTFHAIADAIDDADKLVPDGHRHGDRLLGPGVPVIYMDVGSADGGLDDANKDIVAGNFGDWDFLKPQSGLGFRLYHRLHRFLHEPKLSE
jgi:hypothetical protein